MGRLDLADQEMTEVVATETLTAKAELLQIRKLDKALKSIEREIDQCRADMYTLHATDYSKDRVSGGQGEDISEKVAKLSEYLDERNKQWDELINVRTQVRAKIDNVSDYLLRTVLVEYYVLQHTWEEVSIHIGYSWPQTHRLHAKSLQAYEDVNMI